MFKEVQVDGPYSGEELVDKVTDCQIYYNIF